MRAHVTAVIAFMLVSTAAVHAGTYRCVFLKEGAGVGEPCSINSSDPNISSCERSFSKSLVASCFAAKKNAPIVDQLNCIFRNPNKPLGNFVRAAQADLLRTISEEPGFVSGGGTYTSEAVGALTVGYQQKASAPTLIAQCVMEK